MSDMESEIYKTFRSSFSLGLSLLAGAGINIGAFTALIAFDNSFTMVEWIAISGALSGFGAIALWDLFSLESFLRNDYEFELVEKEK